MKKGGRRDDEETLFAKKEAIMLKFFGNCINLSRKIQISTSDQGLIVCKEKKREEKRWRRGEKRRGEKIFFFFFLENLGIF